MSHDSKATKTAVSTLSLFYCHIFNSYHNALNDRDSAPGLQAGPLFKAENKHIRTRFPVAQGKLECGATLKVPDMYRKITGEPSAPFFTKLGAGPVARLEAIELGRTWAFVLVEQLEEESKACSFFFPSVLVLQQQTPIFPKPAVLFIAKAVANKCQ